MTRLESNIRRWLGDEKTFSGQGEPGLVVAIVQSYQMCRAEDVDPAETLEALASICGYEDVLKMLGSSICGSDGSRSLTLRPH